MEEKCGCEVQNSVFACVCDDMSVFSTFHVKLRCTFVDSSGCTVLLLVLH